MVMRMDWDSKTSAAAAVDCSSTTTEAVQDYSTCLMLYSPALPEAEDSQQENAIWRSYGDGEACGVSSDLQTLRGSCGWCSVYCFPRFYCRQGIIFLLFKGAWGEILSGLGLL